MTQKQTRSNMQKLRSEYTRIQTTEGAEEEAPEEKNMCLEMGYFFAQVILGIVMVTIGHNYTWQFHNGGEEGVSTDEDNLCPNGAAWWLWIAGILYLVLPTTLGLCCGSAVLVMQILDFAMIIWGSVVVFGAWANWTDDFNVYKADPEELNFCAHTPMMTAFVILILKWVICNLSLRLK